MKLELKLDEKETEEIILEWAVIKFPGVFNEIRISAQFGHLESVTLYKKNPPDKVSDRKGVIH